MADRLRRRGTAHPSGRDRRADRPSSERGSITLWLLGLCVVLLFVGGLALDLWRALAERQALAGAADAAVAAASAELDEDAFRTDGTVVLDPEAARRRAREEAAERLSDPQGHVLEASATAEQVRVRVGTELDLTLLMLLRPTADPLRVEVDAAAAPEARR